MSAVVFFIAYFWFIVCSLNRFLNFFGRLFFCLLEHNGRLHFLT